MNGLSIQLAAAGTVLAASVVAWTWSGPSGAAQAGAMMIPKHEARHPSFKSATAFAVGPAVATADPARKGDRLDGCPGETWPNLSAGCLGAAAEPARTVTVEYRTKPATSVLVRLPAMRD
ncbi:hypothetical protein ACUN0C_02325 [Faunimonas sp. B44]|uniref:hypothetical protein n=1 Tax=Faunimonas sp. B44 TaxID=3461493 RepID=UPI00404410CA